jgi:hypothetical protein
MDKLSIYSQIASQIIQQQESIIGPIAVERAMRVDGLAINWNQKEVLILGDPKTTIEHLVKQYQELFGEISVEVCREAVASSIAQLTTDQIPAVLM